MIPLESRNVDIMSIPILVTKLLTLFRWNYCAMIQSETAQEAQYDPDRNGQDRQVCEASTESSSAPFQAWKEEAAKAV